MDSRSSSTSTAMTSSVPTTEITAPGSLPLAIGSTAAGATAIGSTVTGATLELGLSMALGTTPMSSPFPRFGPGAVPGLSGLGPVLSFTDVAHQSSPSMAVLSDALIAAHQQATFGYYPMAGYAPPHPHMQGHPAIAPPHPHM